MKRAWRHGCCLCLKAFAWIAAPFRNVEARGRRLREIEELGWEAETPLIATAGVLLVVFPMFIFLAGAAFAAYYLSGA